MGMGIAAFGDNRNGPSDSCCVCLHRGLIRWTLVVIAIMSVVSYPRVYRNRVDNGVYVGLLLYLV